MRGICILGQQAKIALGRSKRDTPARSVDKFTAVWRMR